MPSRKPTRPKARTADMFVESPTRALVIGLAVGVVGLALGGSVLATADTDRKLFEGSGMAAGGAIFLGYTIFAFFSWRRRLKKGA